MTDNFHEIEDLIIRHLKKELTDEEQAVLNTWIEASAKNKEVFDQLNNKTSLETKFQAFHKLEQGKEEARQGLLISTPIRNMVVRANVRRVWPRVAVAASIVLTLGVGSYFLFFDKSA